MLIRFTLIFAFFITVSLPATSGDKLPEWAQEDSDGRQARTRNRRGQWGGMGPARCGSAGPGSAAPAILEAMSQKDTVADNWLRTAFDQIAEPRAEKGGQGDRGSETAGRRQRHSTGRAGPALAGPSRSSITWNLGRASSSIPAGWMIPRFPLRSGRRGPQPAEQLPPGSESHRRFSQGISRHRGTSSRHGMPR